MSPWIEAGLWVLAAYLIGSIPFGYLVARSRGVDIFRAGSGNIGATNVGRVVGREWGVLVFLLDFGKGALGTLLGILAGTEFTGLPVACAMAAFLGHMYPVYLGFRGGKGAATGLATVSILLPGPAGLAALVWVSLVSASRTVSLASLGGAVALIVGTLLASPSPFGDESIYVTLYSLGGSALVVFRHRGNIARLMAGTENTFTDKPLWRIMSKTLHVLAVGLWFGSTVWFIVQAPIIFASFKETVLNAPSNRTANMPLLTEEQLRDEETVNKFYNALAGTAVSPLFRPFYVLSAVCAAVALATAVGWCCAAPRRRVDQFRSWVIGLAALTVAGGWFLAEKVGEWSALRYTGETEEIRRQAYNSFERWHEPSLWLLAATALLVTVAMGLAAALPPPTPPAREGN